jgi:hypothetical protein
MLRNENPVMTAHFLVIPGRGPQSANPESRSKNCVCIWIPDRRFAASGMTQKDFS